MERAEKKELVTALNAALDQSGVVVAARYQGLTVAEMQDLRVRMKRVGATLRVAKNRLVKLALQGTASAGAADLFKGQTVLGFSNDPISAPKVMVDYAKANEKLVILGGAVGTTNLNPAGVATLAATPPIEELRARLLGVLSAPATKLVRTIAEPASALARVLDARAKQSEAA